MNSSRNVCIFGFSLLFGLALPKWLQAQENAAKINTGICRVISVDRCEMVRYGVRLSVRLPVPARVQYSVNQHGTVYIVRPSVHSFVRLSVCPSACPSTGPQQQTRCCRFAAVGPAGRRYRSIAAAAACDGRIVRAVLPRSQLRRPVAGLVLRFFSHGVIISLI